MSARTVAVLAVKLCALTVTRSAYTLSLSMLTLSVSVGVEVVSTLYWHLLEWDIRV